MASSTNGPMTLDIQVHNPLLEQRQELFMYAIAIIRYRKPIEDVQKHLDAHRAYCQGLKQEGLLLASGPVVPRNGGVLLLRIPDNEAQATLDSIRDNDPYTRAGVAQYELWPWTPVFGAEDLDRL